MMAETFPNPLRIGMGEGRFWIGSYTVDHDIRGILFKDTGEPHTVGDDAPDVPGSHEPEVGEVYLEFANVESAEVVLGAMQELVRKWHEDTN